MLFSCQNFKEFMKAPFKIHEGIFFNYRCCYLAKMSMMKSHPTFWYCDILMAIQYPLCFHFDS